MNLDNLKYKDKSFGEVSKMVQDKYGERYDPISLRGLMKEMEQLRKAQDVKKAEQEMDQQVEQLAQQASQPQGMNPQGFSMNNQGVGPEQGMGIPEQPTMGGDFSREASQGYNQEFAGGGLFNEIDNDWGTGRTSNSYVETPFRGGMKGLDFSFLNNVGVQNVEKGNQDYVMDQVQQAKQTYNSTGHQRDPLMYAPVLGGVAALINGRRLKPTPIQRNMVDESLATASQARQTQFQKTDVGAIERGITDQARSFSGSNRNISGGNAGMFMANELGNQSNIMNAIAQARMGAQQNDLQVDSMNAQEQSRVDQMRNSQNSQRAQIQGNNAALNLQYQDIDDRNNAAYIGNQNTAIQSMLGNLGAIGKENTQSNMILKALGYDLFGNYGGKGTTGLSAIMNAIKSMKS